MFGDSRTLRKYADRLTDRLRRVCHVSHVRDIPAGRLVTDPSLRTHTRTAHAHTHAHAHAHGLGRDIPALGRLRQLGDTMRRGTYGFLGLDCQALVC